MFQTSKYFSKYKYDGKLDIWNFAAMDKSGKFFFVDVRDAYKIAVKLLKQGKRDSSLVYFSRSSKTKMFFDIDSVGELSASQVIRTISQFVQARYPSHANDMLVLKNTKYPKYHIYFPQIILLKTELDKINIEINKLLVSKQKEDLFASNIVDQMIDESIMKRAKGSLLRLEGFNKFDKRTNSYEQNTYYQVIHPKNVTMDIHFFCQTSLLVSDAEMISSESSRVRNNQINQRSDLMLSVSDISIQSAESNSKSKNKRKNQCHNKSKNKVSNSNNASSENDEDLSQRIDSLSLSPLSVYKQYQNNRRNNNSNSNNDDSNHNGIDNNDENEDIDEQKDNSDSDDDSGDDSESDDAQKTMKRLSEEYPELITFLESYPIRNVKIFDDVIIFDMDKSKKARYCIGTGQTHQSNNQYLVFILESEKLFQKCHDSECAHLSALIWKNVNMDEEFDNQMLDDDINEVVNTSNDGMARKFAEYFGDSWVWTPLNGKSESSYFHYNGILYDEDDSQQTALQHFLANNFHAVIVSELKSDRDKGLITEKQYQQTRKSVKNNLETDGKKRSIIRTIRQYIRQDVEFDTNPYLIVFRNGVYNVKTDEFGASSPDEYVSSKNHLDWEFIPFEKLDPVKFEEFVKILEDALEHSDEKMTRKQVFGTCLIGEVLRDFGYQESLSGHSAKSLGTSLVLAVTGEGPHNYGMRAESTMFTNKQDRATFAQLDRKRVLIVEEASRYKPLDGNSLDQLLGAGTFTARRFNSAQSHNQAHCTVIINSNDAVQESIHPYKPATKDRTVYIPYCKEYVKFESEVDTSKKKFLRNVEYSSKDWMKAMVPYMFHYMAQGAREWIANRKIVAVSQRMQQQLDNKPVDARNFMPWFNNLAKKTNNETEGILLSDLCTKFEDTKYFKSLSVRDQRKSVSKRLENEIDKNRSLKQCFFKNKYIKGRNFRKILHLHEWKHEQDQQQFSIKSKLQSMSEQAKNNESEEKNDQNASSQNQNKEKLSQKEKEKEISQNNNDNKLSQNNENVLLSPNLENVLFSPNHENLSLSQNKESRSNNLNNNDNCDTSLNSQQSQSQNMSFSNVSGSVKRPMSSENVNNGIEIPPFKKVRK